MQQTDWQKTLEVVVKGFVGAIVALAGLWVLGWVFSFIGAMLIGLAGIVVGLLKFLVPVGVIAAIVYFFVSQMRPESSLSNTEARAGKIQIDHKPSITVDVAIPAKTEVSVEVKSSQEPEITPKSEE